jgi:metal-responsive CopG/Arc/MetJ family transcriptional regulator
MVRLQPELAIRIDEWSAEQEDAPSRPEAIRRLVEQQLAGKPKGKGRK